MLNIIDFAESILLENKGKLFPPQKVVLKLLYGLELTTEELELANKWGAKPGNYNTLILEAGRGASKSTLASIIALYEFYSVIENPKFIEESNLLPNSPIHLLVFAQSQDQVQQTIYGSIKDYLKNSAYFQQQEEIKATYDSIKYKTISILPKHMSSAALVGFNIKCSVVDNIARIDYSILDNLIKNVIKPGIKRFPTDSIKTVYTSSAYAKGDALELLKESADESTLVLSLTTWDLNTSKRREDYEDEYLDNPNKFLLEFENIRYK
jgi:hypothetical protein